MSKKGAQAQQSPPAEEVSKSAEAYKLLLAWKDDETQGDYTDKAALTAALMSKFPSQGTAQQWESAISNARGKAIKEGLIIPQRRRSAHQPGASRRSEPSLSDLYAVSEWVRGQDKPEAARKMVGELVGLAEVVGGIDNLFACLEALEKLSGGE